MKAALELGRWVFLAPIGYLNAPRSMGKSLIDDPERAPLVRRAFQDYATGQYTKEHLLKRARAWRVLESIVVVQAPGGADADGDVPRQC
jgi:hypothetical protein